MTTGLTQADATELAEMIRLGKVSSVEVVQAHLDRIEALNPRLNAIVTLADGSLEAARAADEELAAGGEVGPLHGVPFTVKDSYDTAGVLTQRGSPIFAGRIPDTDATAVARMKQAGGIVLAKTNLPEFSYWIESDNLLTGRTNNPWDLDRSPGGSSGGESASIAVGMSPLGLATDLSISIRGPAADTGVVSFKPSHGRVPMTGIWPRAPRRDWHAGPMARTIRDLALAYSLLAGPDGADGSSTLPPEFDTGVGTDPGRPLRVGWLVDSGLGPTDPEVAATVEAAADALRTTGAQVDAVSIPALERDNPLDLWNKLSVMEVKPAFQEVTAGHEDQMFSYSKVVESLPDTPMEDYIRAEQGVGRLRDGFAAFFHSYDLLLLPVTTIPAHEHQLGDFTLNGQTVGAFHVSSTTVPFNLTGLPALSMRFGTSGDGMPIAVQLAASWYAESTILHSAALLESLSPVRGQYPDL
ncbi:amidase [Streptomyces liangshanensis]|uniref:Amidase n=1 Tax=Streptomyces liangshanensis TaxID=2717324 RepID=A0A6G9H5F1_9ACTN|nr:amidase [Streptomyces liangshanensis]QIQ05674.1 amidase [Streptomyces liangshanensis]